MSSLSLLGLCVFSLTQTAAGLQSSDPQVRFALIGDTVILPCGIPSLKSCASVNWNVSGEFSSVSAVVKAGQVVEPNFHRFRLMGDCSLRINHLLNNDARLYTCESDSRRSNVSLQILQIAEEPKPAEGKIELHCYLNMYHGHVSCTGRDVHIQWSTEDNTPLNGSRFSIKNPSLCFSKLIILKKPTDHRRTWKCQFSQNATVKVTTSYMTTVKDGTEEVFAAVGESVSLSCQSTSSAALGGAEWAVGGRPLTNDASPGRGHTKTFHVRKDSSLLIHKVKPSYSDEYQCSESSGQQKVLNKVRLHILDVTVKYSPGRTNLTLTCLLTCAQQCEQDFSLSWCGGSGQRVRQRSLMADNNTITSQLVVPAPPAGSAEVTCCVLREGAMVMSKTWRSANSLQTLAWFVLPLGLLVCVAAGALWTFMRRKHKKDAGTETSRVEMTHVYEDVNIDQPHLPGSKQEATDTDSFYALLQAVN